MALPAVGNGRWLVSFLYERVKLDEVQRREEEDPNYVAKVILSLYGTFWHRRI